MLNHFPTSSSGKKRNRLPYGVCTLSVARSTRLVQHIYGAIQQYAVPTARAAGCDVLTLGQYLRPTGALFVRRSLTVNDDIPGFGDLRQAGGLGG